jgi:phenylacetate-coenzyme A ligase PaaK-like adenylate-forming protein
MSKLTLTTYLADPAILTRPLSELAQAADVELGREKLFARAARSGLYRSRWRAARVNPDRLSSRADLRRLPFIDEADLRAMNATGRTLRQALLAKPRTWVTSLSAGNAAKWLPVSQADIARWLARVERIRTVLGTDVPALVLAINRPLPQVSNGIPYLWERADYLYGERCLEFIIVATEMLARNHWDRFAVQKQPELLMASVEDARCLAAALQSGPAPAERQAQPPLTRLKRGIFWGAPLDGPHGTRAEMENCYGLEESYSLYVSAECQQMYCECRAHAGLHLWMDGAIHEVLTERGALFVDEAAPGTEGEYVLTTYNDSLPLVRYRTGDRIRVVGNEPCACGITHPRVQFLGKISSL